jgi:hypothetical protein
MKTLITNLLTAAIIFSTIIIKAQSAGSISGYIYSANDSLSIPGANVLIDTGLKKYWANTDLDGFFKIKPIEPGTYSILITYAGSDSLRLSEIKVSSGFDTKIKKTFLTSKSLGETEIIADLGLIDEDGGMIIKLDKLVLDRIPAKGDMKAVLSYMSTDFYVSERSQNVLFRGSREGASAFYIDGIRSETMTLPGLGVGYMQIYSGGVPARFGDFTGGVIEVETKSYNDWLEEMNSKDLYVLYTDAPTIVSIAEFEKMKANQSTNP